MATSLAAACVPATFGNLALFGAEILSLQTNLVTNFSASVPGVFRFTQPSTELKEATFCNVTVTYTHPGQNDNIIVEAWLPASEDDWNSRFLAVGGGGFVAGRFVLSYANMQGALADGYATITTDAGLGSTNEPSSWALLSPGNVNPFNLQNIAYVSLNDEAIIGKSLIKSYYGKPPSYSYWNGCSQGGRQGMMLAQRYPTAYDGISAAAPAIFWTELFTTVAWTQHVMKNVLGAFPHMCELDAITNAAIAACDALDGVVDSIVAETDACLATFDPFQLVGAAVPYCRDAVNGETVSVTRAAAAVANASWHGITSPDGTKQLWYGFNPGANLTNVISDPRTGATGLGPAATNCTSGSCVGLPNGLALPWWNLFIARGDPGLAFNAINTTAEFDSMMHLSKQLYSHINTDDADLTEFRDAGGKIVSFHGLADTTIPPNGTRHYFNSVAAKVSNIDTFYRHYEIPGMGHCFGGPTGQPSSLFEQLRAWVENGTAPGSTPIQVTNLDGKLEDRILCPYPQKARLLGSDSGVVGGAGYGNSTTCSQKKWVCVDSTDGLNASIPDL
ncbi:tannase and feruloyl esterase [Podospora didyma]|uniref:Carboxylic ester hydrolase n=1 Tax=Podospora didyma TaxID=330526 RepID=A0AAE0K0D8_9PEZI|nr:tannase and feruloyl esterase [Podospora didyma]